MILGTGIGRKSIRDFVYKGTTYHEVGKYCSVLFLPLFPLGKMLLKEAGNLSWEELKPGNKERERVLENTGGFGSFGLSFFWGWAIPIVMYVSVWLALEEQMGHTQRVNFQYSEEDQALMKWGESMHDRLADPHIGDYLIMKFPHEEPPYVLYKIQEISNDSIYCHSSKIGWKKLEYLRAALADSSQEREKNFWYKEIVFPYSIAELESLYLLPDSLVNKGKGKIIEPFRYEAPSIPAAGEKVSQKSLGKR